MNPKNAKFRQIKICYIFSRENARILRKFFQKMQNFLENFLGKYDSETISVIAAKINCAKKIGCSDNLIFEVLLCNSNNFYSFTLINVTDS